MKSNPNLFHINGWAALLLFPLILGGATSFYYQTLDGPRPIIQFEYRSTSNVLSRWDFDRGNGWEVNNRVRWTLAGSTDFVLEEVMLPQWPAKKMKVNFDQIEGEIEFRNLRILHAENPEEVEKIAIDDVKPVAETVAFQKREDGFSLNMVGEKVPSVGWPLKNYKSAWDYDWYQAPFFLRFARASLLYALCLAAVMGPCFLSPRNDRE